MKTKLYFDRRNKGAIKDFPVKIAISVKSKTAYIATGIYLSPEQWDATANNAKKAAVAIKLTEKKLVIDKTIESLRISGRLHLLSARDIKELILQTRQKEEEALIMSGKTVLDCFEEYISLKNKPGTITVYRSTIRRLRACPYFKDSYTFDDITAGWLRTFEGFLAETAPSANARGIHLRNLRTVFNYSIREGYTTAPYPFKVFKIKGEPTKDRSLSAEELRTFFNAECPDTQAKYRDIFKLSFLLCGINLEDLLQVRELKGGRIEVNRAKTGQPISIKVPQQASDIIYKYKGKDYLLNILDRCHNYKNYLHRLNDNLKSIGKIYNAKTKKWEGESLFPDISYYWARYSWATIAAELDIPERTIGAALAHSTAKSVTSIYTRVEMRKKIDAANLAVFNEVFKI